jgi:hypothetical protein
MDQPIKLIRLLAFIGLLSIAACKEDRIDLDTDCIEAKGLAFQEHCENTFLVQLPGRYGSLGRTIDFDGQSYHRVVKIAGGNITLYDGFSTNDRVFLKLRKYDPQTDHDLITSQHPCLALYGPRFTDLPIYVVNAISEERCP